MLSVIIPTWNAERTLTATLTALVPAVVDGLVGEVIIVDCGSTDQTREIADASGAKLIDCPKGRGVQLAAGGADAKHQWLLFLHGDTVLSSDWHHEVAELIGKVEIGEHSRTAATFRFALNDTGMAPRVIEWGVGIRCWLLALPFGDQGLLISRTLYNEIGGYKPMPLFEDLDIVRRLGRRRLLMLRATATTSAIRYKQSGYAARVARNWWCITRYYMGTAPEKLRRIYDA